MYGRSNPVRALSTALLAVTLAGTAVGAQAPKEGSAPEPVVLDLLVGYASDGWPIDLFKSKVAELSGGQLEIRSATSSPSEASVAEGVLSGDADLGHVFARGLDGIGAKGFQALLAPFVANDAELLRAVATGPIGAEILAELAEHDLEGLAIVPGHRRFIVGLGKPFVSLEDFAGATINVPETASNFALIRALGAQPSGADWNTLEEAEAAGLDGVITSINSTGYPGMVVTGNLAVQAVPGVWFASAATMAELSPEHREILRTAALAAQAAVLDGFEITESSVVPCSAGARIVTASDEDIAAIVAAAEPVIDEMASDPVTASFLQRIAALKTETTPAPFPASCEGGSPPDAATTRIPDGTYSATVTYRHAQELGTNPDECVRPDRTQNSTLVIEGVNWTALGSCGDGPTWEGAHGTFEYDGDTLVMRETGFAGLATFEWAADDASVTLTLLGTDPELAPPNTLRFLFEHEFARVSPGAETLTIPDGTYSATVTHEVAQRTGWSNNCTTPDRSGVVTLVIEGSDFTEFQQCGDGDREIGSEGTLEYEGDTLTMRSPGIPGGATFAWSADDSRFTLELVRVDDEVAWPPEVMRFMFEHEFTRTSP